MSNARREAIPDELHQLIEALTTAVDARDHYTAQHSWRVAELSGRLAEALGMAPPEVAMMHVAGHLHDVGKIGVPDAVLNKPGPLTDDEFSTIMLHPVIGWQIISQVDALSSVVGFVRHHHERRDGRGYPDGLGGDDVPLGARLIAITDAFDAMLSDRPYRRAMSLEQALAELEHHRGQQFDPGLLDSFLPLADELYAQLYPAPAPRGTPATVPVEHATIRHSVRK